MSAQTDARFADQQYLRHIMLDFCHAVGDLSPVEAPPRWSRGSGSCRRRSSQSRRAHGHIAEVQLLIPKVHDRAR